MRRRGGLSFLNGCAENRQFRAFCKVSRNDVFLHLLLFVHPSAKASAEGVPNALPTHLDNPSALCPKFMRTAHQRDGCFFIHERFFQRAQQPGADEVEQVAFARRQGIDALRLSGHCGGWDDGGVVADFAVIHNPFGMQVQFQGGCERQRTAHAGSQFRQFLLHVLRQIPAVRARVGQQLLLVQTLGVIQRLLGSEAKQPVGILLKRGQIIQQRRMLAALPACNLLHHCIRRAIAAFQQGTGFGQAIHAFRLCGKRVSFQLHGKERRGVKVSNRRFPLHQHRQRRAHDAPRRKRPPVQQRIQARGVDANQPIRLCAAQRRTIKIVIVAHGLHPANGLANRTFFC